jgi:hypothetical protein
MALPGPDTLSKSVFNKPSATDYPPVGFLVRNCSTIDAAI